MFEVVWRISMSTFVMFLKYTVLKTSGTSGAWCFEEVWRILSTAFVFEVAWKNLEHPSSCFWNNLKESQGPLVYCFWNTLKGFLEPLCAWFLENFEGSGRILLFCFWSSLKKFWGSLALFSRQLERFSETLCVVLLK